VPNRRIADQPPVPRSMAANADANIETHVHHLRAASSVEGSTCHSDVAVGPP
jgi:hypothetical protein